VGTSRARARNELNVRIALHQTGEVGARAGRVILAERDLSELGLVDSRPSDADSRVRPVTDLADYDVVVTDAAAPGPIIEQALDREINCVVWVDFESTMYDAAFVEITRSLVVGANLANGITPALAVHEVARGGEIFDIVTAWTEPGKPLRRGESVQFPEPVGSRWARPSSHARPNALVAPIEGEWAAGLARVTSAGTSGVSTRIVGVADSSIHLESLALASAALAVATSAYPPGLHHADAAAERFLDHALTAGLDVAAYTVEAAD
jgi:hypothetical protein